MTNPTVNTEVETKAIERCAILCEEYAQACEDACISQINNHPKAARAYRSQASTARILAASIRARWLPDD